MKKFNILCLAAALAAPLLTGCSSGSDTPDEPTAPDTASYTITLVAKDGGMNSRAGLPYEAALEEEGLIYEATILIYSTSLGSAGDDDIIKYAYYESFASGAANQTMKIPNMIIGTYKIIALVNCGDQSGLRGTKLKVFRDMEYTGAPFENVSSNNIHDYKKFVMTSDAEQEIIFSSTDTTIPTLTVERLTSRVDLRIFGFTEETTTREEEDGTTSSTTLYKAKVYDYDTENKKPETDIEGNYVETGEYMTLSYIWLQNINKSSTYYIQRSANASGTVTYFQDEVCTTDETDGTYATYYVKSPTVSYLDYYGWNAEDIFQGYNHVLIKSTNNSVNTYNTDDDGNTFYTITYIGEYTNYATSYDATKETITDIPYLQIDFSYDTPSLSGSAGTGHFRFPIMHCQPNGDVIASKPTPYAVIRNTIYRYSIRFFSDDKYVYVRWYYYKNNATEETFYSQTKFAKSIFDANGDESGIND